MSDRYTPEEAAAAQLSVLNRGVAGTIERGLGARDLLEKQLAEAGSRQSNALEEMKLLENVVALLAALQETWKERFQAAIGQIVSEGLAGVFGEKLELVCEIGQSGDRPTARFAVRDSRGLETEIMDARGGGLVNVVSFLLRVLVLLSARPAMRRLLILDEPFNNVSGEFIEPVIALLQRIAEDGDMQMLIVSHNPDMARAADVAYEFRLEDGVTKVRRLHDRGQAVAEGAEG